MRIDFLSDSPETLQESHLSQKDPIMFLYYTYQGRKRMYITHTQNNKKEKNTKKSYNNLQLPRLAHLDNSDRPFLSGM